MTSTTMRTAVSIGAAALTTLGSTAIASAATYWVAPAGADTAAGTQSAPFLTIQHAVDTMNPGDTVTVMDGSYAGFWMKNRQGDAQHRFSIRSQNPLGAAITGPSATASDPNDNVQLVSVSFATIDGFEVTGAARAGISIRTLGDDTGSDTTDDVVQNCHSHDNGGGTTAGRHDGVFTGFARNVVIQNNEVDHNSEHGVYVSNSADNPTISFNKSHDNLANGLQINADVSTGGDGVITGWKMEGNIVYGNHGGAAINLDGASSGLLRNNLVYGNTGAGITLYMGDAAEASQNNVVVANTVYNPAGTRSAIQIGDGADNNIVFDNVFFSGATGMEIQSVTGLVHDYNAVCSYSGGSATAHETDPTVSSMFIDASDANFLGGPALVDQGIGSLGGAAAPTTDLAGNPRPQGAAFDIGCYEQTDHGSVAQVADAAAAETAPMNVVDDDGGDLATTDGSTPTESDDAGTPSSPVATADAATMTAHPVSTSPGTGAFSPGELGAAGTSGCSAALGPVDGSASGAIGFGLALLGLRRKRATERAG